MVANSSSRGEGWREPSLEAKVPAPHGEPPWTWLRSAIWAVGDVSFILRLRGFIATQCPVKDRRVVINHLPKEFL